MTHKIDFFGFCFIYFFLNSDIIFVEHFFWGVENIENFVFGGKFEND